MTTRRAAVAKMWRHRHGRIAADRGYVVFLTLAIATVTVLPAVRASFLWFALPSTVAVLSTPTAVRLAVLVLVGILLTALLASQERGPVVVAPFVAHALGTSEMSRAAAFGRRTWTTIILVAAASGLLSLPLGAAFDASIAFVSGGSAIGAIVAVSAVLGQTCRRLATVLAGVITLAALIISISLAPSATVRVGDPDSFGVHVALWLTAGVAFAIVPFLIERLDETTMVRHARNWDRALRSVATLEFDDFAGAVSGTPLAGSGRSAVMPSRRRSLVVAVKDATVAARRPVRLVIGLGVVLVGDVALLLLSADDVAQVVLAAFAALGVYLAMGVLTAGMRHALEVAQDLPLFGISDGRIVLMHCTFPLGVLVAVALCAAWAMRSAGHAVDFSRLALIGLLLPLTLLAARASGALRGPGPWFLLAPLPTVFGDPMPAIRVLWALDSFILAGLAGATIARGSDAVIPTLVVLAAILSTLIMRWRRRP